MVTLRPATPADVSQVAQVWSSAWHDGHRGHVPQTLVEARDDEYFLARSRELLEHTTVAVDADELVGLVIVKGDELQQLMVSSAARGKGVGGLLIRDAERAVADAGHPSVWLAVVPGNVGARQFYESRGWTDAGEFTYDSVTLRGATVPVPVRRYVKTFPTRR